MPVMAAWNWHEYTPLEMSSRRNISFLEYSELMIMSMSFQENRHSRMSALRSNKVQVQTRSWTARTLLTSAWNWNCSPAGLSSCVETGAANSVTKAAIVRRSTCMLVLTWRVPRHGHLFCHVSEELFFFILHPAHSSCCSVPFRSVPFLRRCPSKKGTPLLTPRTPSGRALVRWNRRVVGQNEIAEGERKKDERG